jgi:sugar lactone lactonase YvrE
VVLTFAIAATVGAGPSLGTALAGAPDGTVTIPPTTCPSDGRLPSGTIATIAGSGEPGSSGDGGPATEASFELSFGHVAFDGADALYFADGAAKTIRRIGTDGLITTAVGPASGTDLVDPAGVAIDDAGNMYVADFGASRIWKIDPDGATTVFAGTGTSGSDGDGGPATEATINAAGMAFGPDGDMYIDDLYRYRRIDPAGIIHAFAGTGTPGFSGDGGAALEATFSANGGMVSTDQSGAVYIADAGNHRVRKVDPSGVITTVIGDAGEGYAGDGGPAAEARIGTPHAVASDESGDIFFTDDWDSSSIRRIDAAGNVSTVAGQKSSGFSGDCGPAISAELSQPFQVAMHKGILYILDSNNNRIRIVVP